MDKNSLQMILDGIDQYVFCKNKLGVYIYANEPFALIAGLSSKYDVLGKTDRDLVWSKQADSYALSDKKVLSGAVIVKQQQTQVRAENTSNIMMSKRPHYDHSGEIIGVVGNFFDLQDKLVFETKGKYDEQKRRLHLGFVPEWLSFAEVKICFYLIQGFSAVKIAEKSGITVSTVRYHIDNIKNKMQCSKMEIPEVAMKTGIAWKIMSLQHTDVSDSIV